MDTKASNQTEKQIMIEEVNRVIKIGRILLSVLTNEEIKELRRFLSPQNAIGNTGDS
jgi:hypothetical protein